MSSQMCLGGCGFFGNPNNGGYCSKCIFTAHGQVWKAPAPPSGEGKVSSLLSKITVGVTEIQVRHGDMTAEPVDVIVNAANSSLDHASGLAGAIIKKGGDIIQYESDAYVKKNGRLEEGELAVTTAGKLPCKHVFHSVGPMWHGGQAGEDLILGVAVRNCLEKAESMGLTSISLPAISSGIFGFPKDKCATIMFDIATQYVKDTGGKTKIKEIRFTNFDDRTVDIFKKECTSRKDEPLAPSLPTPPPDLVNVNVPMHLQPGPPQDQPKPLQSQPDQSNPDPQN